MTAKMADTSVADLRPARSFHPLRSHHHADLTDDPRANGRLILVCTPGDTLEGSNPLGHNGSAPGPRDPHTHRTLPWAVDRGLCCPLDIVAVVPSRLGVACTTPTPTTCLLLEETCPVRAAMTVIFGRPSKRLVCTRPTYMAQCARTRRTVLYRYCQIT